MKSNNPHTFDEENISLIQNELLDWYRQNKRDLPWRRAALTDNKQQHAYAVWVSEIMLQQTRVATVIDYYKKWMLKWPTVHDLAKANMEEVNQVWAGLGYYSRARRLHEGACKVVKDFNGQIPENATDLMKLIPGVGRYTAAAIASIAFNESVGVLDGNVIRVISRLLTIGGDVSSKNVTHHLWDQVDKIIPSDQPGDFNQAMMELGALVCMPKNPVCSRCPLRSVCKGYKEVENYKKTNTISASNLLLGKNNNKNKRKASADGDNSKIPKRVKVEIEELKSINVDDIESCTISFLKFPDDKPWLPALGVMNYPRKADKKPPRQDIALLSVVELKHVDNESKMLVTQRPDTGLLAKLWEFPTLTLNAEQVAHKSFKKHFSEKGTHPTKHTTNYISENTDGMLEKYLSGLVIKSRSHVGELTHVFSHIHLRYIMEHIIVSPDENKTHSDISKQGAENWKWVLKSDLASWAMSSAMHKILKICEPNNSKKCQKPEIAKKNNKNQVKLDFFFKPKLRSIKKEKDITIKQE
uniref:adenine DNA glycosylase-like n=1 Tax=Styela clava TaxID=7725 RepID=UPI0019394F3F|nr:adenine DNA glycosylase-like [Styela clava]